MNNQIELIQRWDIFLQKIETRLLKELFEDDLISEEEFKAKKNNF